MGKAGEEPIYTLTLAAHRTLGLICPAILLNTIAYCLVSQQ